MCQLCARGDGPALPGDHLQVQVQDRLQPRGRKHCRWSCFQRGGHRLHVHRRPGIQMNFDFSLFFATRQISLKTWPIQSNCQVGLDIPHHTYQGCQSRTYVSLCSV